MTVYVDDVRHRFGRMVMAHMWADSLGELFAMADRIGVARKWLQQPPAASWVHFDVSLGAKAKALAAGAVLTDRYGPVEHVARMRGDAAKIAVIAGLRARHAAKSAAPRRLAMSRLKGSNLHALSHAANGRPVRVVTRATDFGNPFKFVRDEGCMVFGTREGAEVVALYRAWLCDDPAGQAMAERIRRELAGHNAACFCKLCPQHATGLPLGEGCQECASCHGDVILQVAAGSRWDAGAGIWSGADG